MNSERINTDAAATGEIDGSEVSAEEMAERVVAALVADGHGAKVWTKSGVRVYVTRKLSRGVQDMGYIAITSDGSREYGGLSRNKAGIRDRVEAALAV